MGSTNTRMECGLECLFKSPTCHCCYLLLQLTLAKHKNDIMGMMVMESGYGSAIPACVIVHLSKTGSASKCGLLNIGDHILSINGVNLVGMPKKACMDQIKVCGNVS